MAAIFLPLSTLSLSITSTPTQRRREIKRRKIHNESNTTQTKKRLFFVTQDQAIYLWGRVLRERRRGLRWSAGVPDVDSCRGNTPPELFSLAAAAAVGAWEAARSTLWSSPGWFAAHIFSSSHPSPIFSSRLGLCQKRKLFSHHASGFEGIQRGDRRWLAIPTKRRREEENAEKVVSNNDEEADN